MTPADELTAELARVFGVLYPGSRLGASARSVLPAAPAPHLGVSSREGALTAATGTRAGGAVPSACAAPPASETTRAAGPAGSLRGAPSGENRRPGSHEPGAGVVEAPAPVGPRRIFAGRYLCPARGCGRWFMTRAGLVIHQTTSGH